MTEPGTDSIPVTEPDTGPGTGDRAWYRFRYRCEIQFGRVLVYISKNIIDVTFSDHKLRRSNIQLYIRIYEQFFRAFNDIIMTLWNVGMF